MTSSISVSPLTDNYYFVYSNIGSCFSQANATVNVIPSFSFSVNSPTICSGQTASLIASGANSYAWSNGSSNNSITTLPLYSNTIYTVTGSNGLTCSSTTTTTVFVYHPSANYSGLNESFYTVESILQLTNQSSGAASYKWKLCDNVFSTNTNISLPVKDTGNCCITLIANINSCTDSITKCFKIVPESSISVPNVFTPNGDTKNDLFKVSSTGLKSLNCVIYDRWGLKMYEWDGINGSWDGNSKTGTAPDGTYFYIINYTDLRDKSVTEKGYLNLFK
jgi:gliding motility-associated-like protein